ncbi:hypothetical protein [Cryobacterium sp. CG_9.6]|uniref:hypothetical protein n=1 Tax=Cryobacterium sp. CG_9.6 TaxID=2760710 RepID=UPI002475D09B|nr:hypothetical protein [Cryobacterium sp. CG_9.6]MDH6237456.1 hypothetical protein [Cryobacterium sp. CG_9.6]
MWKKRDSAAKSSVFGVGVQVIVRLDRARFPYSLIDDPIGVIVAPGELTGSSFYVPTTVREAVWEVQFDEPFAGLDGSGPHASAKVPESHLEAAPEA